MGAGYAGRRRVGFGGAAHAGEPRATPHRLDQPRWRRARPSGQRLFQTNRYDDPSTTSRAPKPHHGPNLHHGLCPRRRLRLCPRRSLGLPLHQGPRLGLSLSLCPRRRLCLCPRPRRRPRLPLRLHLCPTCKRLVQPNHSGVPGTTPGSSKQHRRHRKHATGRRSVQDKRFGAPGETPGVLGIPRRNIVLMWWSVY